MITIILGFVKKIQCCIWSVLVDISCAIKNKSYKLVI